MKIIYKNLYNQDINFELEGNEVKVTNIESPLRINWNIFGTKIDSIGPPGGPWLHLGMRLGILDTSLGNKIIDEIRIEEDCIILGVSDRK